MIKNIIPIVFRKLLSPRITTFDIEQYETLSKTDLPGLVFDELSEENAHQFFTGFASHLHKSSHRSVFYTTSISCNFLHLAIQLQNLDMVTQLLKEYQVNPRLNLEYTNSKYDTPHEEKKSMNDFFSITTLELARRVGNTHIIELLNTAMQPSSLNKHELSDSDEGYEADVEAEKNLTAKPIRYKKRLILGDGNLSYSRALAKKQQEKGLEHFSEALTVTEYATEESLANHYVSKETETDFKNFTANAHALREQGAEIIFGVDATKIDQNFNDRRFKRIHFNFPYYNDNTSSTTQKKAKTRELVGRFFESAAKIQQPGDRIHMALVTGFSDPVWYEHATYGIGQFCEQHGYVYIKKHRFIEGTNRKYPGYFHVKTASNTSVGAAENGREFILEKRIPGKEYQNSTVKKKTSRGIFATVLRTMETDSDSSSYVEHSDAELSACISKK